MPWYAWIPTGAVLVMLIALRFHDRRLKKRKAQEVSGFEKAQQLLRLKQEHQRNEISDEEYFLERTRLLE